MRRPVIHSRRAVSFVALVILLSACRYIAPGQAEQAGILLPAQPTVLSSPTQSPPASTEVLSAQPSPTHLPTVTSTVPATALPDAAPSATQVACSQELCFYSGALFLQRPIQAPGQDDYDVSYRFGSTQGGMRDPHHGVEFLNPFGTPVHAAAGGTVVVAGTDLDPTSQHGVWPIIFYGPYSNFYGNLVVIEHSLPAGLSAAFAAPPQPFFTLYGHLSEIGVQIGQTVAAGQQIGKVGQAGIATGSHLHFEVRIGENSYKASRNPEVWLAAKPNAGQPTGAIAGSFFDYYGNRLELPDIVLEHLPDGPEGGTAAPVDYKVSISPYEEKALTGLAPFNESFAVGNLPAGWYRLSFPMGGLREELVQVLPGAVTVVEYRSR